MPSPTPKRAKVGEAIRSPPELLAQLDAELLDRRCRGPSRLLTEEGESR